LPYHEKVLPEIPRTARLLKMEYQTISPTF
jgi:hypothetical protein